MLAVNEKNRVHYGQRARIVDRVLGKDQLYRSGPVGAPLFEAFDPLRHGIWEIAGEGEPVTREVRQRQSAGEVELEAFLLPPGKPDSFDPGSFSAERVYTLRSIRQRRGQKQFRESLLEAYDRKCAVTGSGVQAVLEAAHIFPHDGRATDVISNGLLLRADIHTLYDLLLIRITPEFILQLAPAMFNTEYMTYAGRINLPLKPENRPSMFALKEHCVRCESTFNAA